ncbi:MAG: paraquat-inducible membrane protein A [Desulfobacteraceae bacterium]|nr:MAG: paraquat-inducible membrane protein A [Desulfobacteraceae bacterium]
MNADQKSALTAGKAGLVSCRECRLLSRLPATTARAQPICPRCGATLHPRKPNSIARTWSLVLAAMIMYVPANVLPVMHTTYFGKIKSDTILSGVHYFMISGSWHIALIIFIASVIVPAFKLVVLVFLLISLHRRSDRYPEERTRLYRIIEVIGRWSMVDLFVVTVVVALLQLGSLASVRAGLGAIFFGAVVVITMIAARSFDPRLIWDAMEHRKK